MGVGVHVRGTISGVRTKGEAVEFQVSGSLELAQYRGQRRSTILLEPRTPISVVGRQTSFCFVMIDDSSWSPGPCRAGQIREVLDRAALEKRALKIELGDAVVHFIGETAEVAGSSVIRVFDDKPTTDKQPPSEASCALRTSSMASSSARRAVRSEACRAAGASRRAHYAAGRRAARPWRSRSAPRGCVGVRPAARRGAAQRRRPPRRCRAVRSGRPPSRCSCSQD